GSISLSQEHIDHLNKTLVELSPQEVLRWAVVTFPNLYQTTAFGLTGLVILDMISKTKPVDLIFIDTLHHFPQTYDLVRKVAAAYQPTLHIYKPKGVESEEEFAKKHGDSLWESNDDLYDFLVKVEPAQRAYKELGVNAVLTGRRKSQGGARAALPVIEVEESSGIIKINPLWNWDFAQVKAYITENAVPYNELLDLGYKSIGDWHSTVAVADGEDERSGRWKGKAKTECGIHETSRFAQYLASTSS
uniref:3'-phosphoadenylylsulfate reductase n=1 Tax=Candidozyma auris TaxID=498019 RepID=UPI001C55959B|nr:Chain A, 3'-phosphoadenylylsulfate reductase [[Candida] auris]